MVLRLQDVQLDCVHHKSWLLHLKDLAAEPFCAEVVLVGASPEPWVSSSYYARV